MEEKTFDDIRQILRWIEESNIAEIHLEMGDLRIQARRSFSEESQEEPDLSVSLKAPRLGNFWRALKPGGPPLVEIGQAVNEEDIVCHIEVLDSFYPVTSGAKCRIVKVCAEDGRMVEYNQIIFRGVRE